MIKVAEEEARSSANVILKKTYKGEVEIETSEEIEVLELP